MPCPLLPRIYGSLPSVVDVRGRLVALAALTLVLAACSDTADSDSTSTTNGVAGATAAPGTTIQSGGQTSSSTTEATEITETTSGRPVAPDFTLQLGDGGTYTLSEGAKPVYLVFWAEW